MAPPTGSADPVLARQVRNQLCMVRLRGTLRIHTLHGKHRCNVEDEGPEGLCDRS